MPRITRIHFASLGHRDARFPSLTLDLRDPQGRAADTIIWAENGTGKTSLLNLFFSSYQTSRRQFLGAQSQAKARDLEDYVQDRDLSFIITEWDTTDDHSTPGLLDDGPREWLIVGQLLAWRGLDRSSGDLRRLFFTLRPNRDVRFETLPILGLVEPVTSFEAFRDWLNEQAKRYPKLQVVTETNQGDWRAHLEANHLDPELFAYQLRMNLAEGGVNELFNDLRSDKDFIRLFLELGLDPDLPSRVRANLNEFLPKHRRLSELRIQVAFNERLLIALDLFLDQLRLFGEAEEQMKAVAREASALLAALQLTKQRLTTEAADLASDQQRLGREETSLTSARESIRRRERFFAHHRMKLLIEEAEAERARANRAWSNAKTAVRLVDMAGWLGKLRTLESEASALKQAIAAEQEKVRPEREALERLGADYKFAVEAEAAEMKARLERAQQEKASLHQQLTQLSERRVELERERSARQQEVVSLQQFFDVRERQRDRLRNDGLLQRKEEIA